jgi:hypothetical protein
MVILEATNNDGIFVRVFVGFVFTYSIDRWGVISLTAYDAMRYLQNPVSGKWVGKNGVDVSLIIKDVVRQCGLPKMSEEMHLEEVGVKPIKLLKFAEPGINVIDEILEWAQLKATATENDITTKGGEKYAATRAAERWVFFDNCGRFVLCTCNQMTPMIFGQNEHFVIGTDCAITEMNMSVSIDDSANQVWLLRADTGGQAGWKGEDAECVKKWGPVTYYEKIDNAYCRNNEQMIDRAAIELCTRDIEKRSISITTLGVTGLRAGMLVRINIPWLENYFGEISKSKLVYLDKVNHSWEEGTHTMSFEAEALPGDVDLDIWKRFVTTVIPPENKNSKNQKEITLLKQQLKVVTQAEGVSQEEKNKKIAQIKTRLKMLEGNKYNEEELDKETSSETEDTGFFGSLTSMFSQD